MRRYTRSLLNAESGRVDADDVLALEPHVADGRDGYALLAFWRGGLYWLHTTRLDQLARAIFPDPEP